MSDILEIELQLLKDNSTKSIKTKLKNGEEIILYSPKYVKLLENENTQLDRIITELEEWLKEQGNNGIDEWGNHYSICLYKLNKLKEKYK